MRLPGWVPVLLLVVASEAPAAKWVSITEGSARAVYLDRESVQHNGPDVRAWTREVFTEEQRSPHTGALYYSANSLLRFDCNKRSTVPLIHVLYGSDGTEIRRINLQAVELPLVVTPGSLQEQLLERACFPVANKKPSARHVKVALADTRPKSDVPLIATPVDSAKEPIKATVDPAKPSLNPKPPEAPKSVVPVSKPPLIAASKTTVSAPIKLIEHKIVAPVAPRARYRAPIKVKALTKPSKPAPKIEHSPGEEVHWGYAGKGGPQSWGDLKPEYEACEAGKRQSPIDIQDGAKLELDAIKFDYKPSPLRIVDNGHTIQVNYSEGSSLTAAGVRYELRQLHFHRPSEERVNGRTYDMVAHLVHQSLDGRLAVVAVLMEAGGPNAFIASVWPHLPLESSREISLPDVMVDLNTLLPASRTYYTYMGSLTTPPCTEGVLWLVLKSPVPVSSDQVGIFGKLYSMNARPVQLSNGRLIKESM